MSASVRCALAAVAVVGSLGLIVAAMSARDAPKRSVPATNVITIPGPEQVTGTIDPAGMDWLSRYAATSAKSGH